MSVGVSFCQTLMSALPGPRAANTVVSILWEHMSVFVDSASVWIWISTPAYVS